MRLRFVALGRRTPILILLAIFFILGIAVARDYGQSWDEENYRIYAQAALNSYSPVERSKPDFKIEDTFGPSNLRYYGPAYMMAARLAVSALERLPGGWSENNLWHALNFMVFLAGAYLVWSLASRFSAKLPALAATLLFLTQPLLWGHAFINPKDIPFVTLFLLALACGLRLEDKFRSAANQQGDRGSERKGLREAFAEDRSRPGTSFVQAAWRTGLGLGGLFLLVLLTGGLFRSWISNMLAAAIAQPHSIAGWAFYHLTQNAQSVPLEAYTNKAAAWYNTLGWGLLGTGLLCAAASRAAYFRATLGEIAWRQTRLLRSKAILAQILMAGMVLGFCASVRVLGPFAGALVSLYILLKVGRKTLAALGVYWLAGAIFCYASWPYLWSAPIDHFTASLGMMSNFPNPIPVLYQQALLASNNLPLSFFPVLFTLTLSEPALLLFGLGLLLAVIRLIRGRQDRILLSLLLVWLLLPLAYILIAHPAIYDNGRQFFFIYPAVFILTALAIDWIQALFQRRLAWRWTGRFGRPAADTLLAGLVGLAILPGLTAGFSLHPYQYAYFNSLEGGQAGAFRKYDLDYWLTGYKEAAEYLNQIAPQGAAVIVYGNSTPYAEYAAPSMQVVTYMGGMKVDADYAVLGTRSNMDLSMFPDKKVIRSIGRDGAVYVVIKALR